MGTTIYPYGMSVGGGCSGGRNDPRTERTLRGPPLRELRTVSIRKVRTQTNLVKMDYSDERRRSATLEKHVYLREECSSSTPV